MGQTDNYKYEHIKRRTIDIECGEPPERPKGGTRRWNGAKNFGSEALYTCGAHGKFMRVNDKDEVFYEEQQTISCQWDKKWSDELWNCTCEDVIIYLIRASFLLPCCHCALR